ncbi:MAG: hypothetical protein Aurels2KO_17020 [Aureliella sp.]
MHFCVFSTQQHWGGGETLLWTIAQQLGALGHQVSWVVRSGSEVADFVDSNGGHIAFQSATRLGGPSAWRQLARAVAEQSPDVLLLNDTHAVVMAASCYLMLPKPRPVRLAYKHTVFPMRSRLKYRWLCDKLVCVSEAARDVVVQGGLSPDRTRVIHGGCPVPIASELDKRGQNNLRDELGIRDDEKLLVSVGNLLDCKGHADLVQAVEKLRERYRVRLVIAGQGQERPSLEKQIRQLGLDGRDSKSRITAQLLGYRSDAEALLHAADLVVHPSHAEGLSLVLIQAQMMAKPIVATPVGGAVEVLGAENGDRPGTWLANPRDPISLADAIARALEQLSHSKQEIGSRLERVAKDTRERFSIQTHASALASLAQELRGGSPL